MTPSSKPSEVKAAQRPSVTSFFARPQPQRHMSFGRQIFLQHQLSVNHKLSDCYPDDPQPPHSRAAHKALSSGPMWITTGQAFRIILSQEFSECRGSGICRVLGTQNQQLLLGAEDRHQHSCSVRLLKGHSTSAKYFLHSQLQDKQSHLKQSETLIFYLKTGMFNGDARGILFFTVFLENFSSSLVSGLTVQASPPL